MQIFTLSPLARLQPQTPGSRTALYAYISVYAVLAVIIFWAIYKYSFNWGYEEDFWARENALTGTHYAPEKLNQDEMFFEQLRIDR